MKIGIFDPYLDTLSGGEKYMLSVASCLAKDHEVFIFWDKEKEDEIKQAALKKLGINLSSVKFYKNIFNKKTSIISRFLQSKKFDAIIYLSDGSIPFVGTKLYIHFQFPVEWLGLSLKTKMKLFFVKKIFCNSYFTKYFIDKKLKVNSLILYPPVEIKLSTKINKENIILHVGRFDVSAQESNYKKQDVMVKAFRKMVDKGLRGWRLVMVIGIRAEDMGKAQKLKDMSKGYPIDVIENPSNKTLWEWYGKAKIYWHATGFGENLDKFPEKAEHFGISTVEAMGSGAVPVVIGVGGQREIVIDSRSGYLWGSLEELIEKTNNLIKDPNLMIKMSKDAMRRSKVFSGDRFCKEVKGIIIQ